MHQKYMQTNLFTEASDSLRFLFRPFSLERLKPSQTLRQRRVRMVVRRIPIANHHLS